MRAHGRSPGRSADAGPRGRRVLAHRVHPRRPPTIAPCIGGYSPPSGLSPRFLMRLLKAGRQGVYGVEPLVTSCHFWQGRCVVPYPARHQTFPQPGQGQWLVAHVFPHTPRNPSEVIAMKLDAARSKPSPLFKTRLALSISAAAIMLGLGLSQTQAVPLDN